MTNLPEPTARVVLLGASNLRRGLPTLLRLLHARLGGPLDVLVATGAGRSYGTRSRVLGRELSGVVECELWPALEAAAALPTYALLADVGNDVAYGVRPEQILTWVEACLARLDAASAHTVLSLYPVANAERLPGWLFYTIGRALYPLRKLDQDRVVADLHVLDTGLRELAAQHAAHCVEFEPKWYGLDPIHVRARDRRAAWMSVLAAWPAPTSEAHAVRVSSLRVTLAAPSRRTWFGLERRRRQPALVLGDGTRISLF